MLVSDSQEITTYCHFYFEELSDHSIFAFPKLRELSSAGSEHLPYKQRVTGSNPVAPTLLKPLRYYLRGFFVFLELPNK